MRDRRARAVLVLAGVGLWASACAESDRIDADALGEAVPPALAPEAPEAVTAVLCPERIERGRGVVVACAVTIGGTPITVEVTQLDDDGAVAVRTDAVLLDTVDVAVDLGSRLRADLGVLVGVDCDGPRIIVPAAGDELRCTARDEGGRPLALVVRLLDADGAYEVRPAD
jgi:hypothetical protein